MDLNNKVKPHVSSAPSKHRRESEPEPRRQSWTIEEKSYTKCSPPVLEYMEKSSLHGLQYLAEDGRHWTERLLWTFLVVLGFIITFVFIWPILRKYLDRPTITTIGTRNYPIWKIDFPGVTICPSNKVVEEKLELIQDQSPWAEYIEEFGEIDFANLLHLLTGFRTIPRDKWEDFDNLTEVIDRLGQGNLTTLMQKVMPSCSEFLLQCWWRGEERKCSDLFDVRKTDEGFCCSFNTLEQKQNLDISLVVQSQPEGVVGGIGGIVGWIGSIFDGGDYIDEEFIAPETESESPTVQAQLFSADQEQLDESLKKALEILSRTRRQTNESEEMLLTNQINVTEGAQLQESIPRLERTNSASHHLGLSVLMDAKSNKYFVAPENYVGFKVMAHNPTTFPEVNSKGSIIDTGKEAFIAVSAEYTESTPLVRKLHVQKRNCIFADEKNVPNAEITVFKFYSQENCLLECRAKILLRTCGCLPYYYPRLDAILQFQEGFQNLTAACTLEGWKCLMSNKHILEALDPRTGEQTQPGLDMLPGARCFCPPSCTNTVYLSSHSQATFPNKASRVMKELREKQKYKNFDRESDLSLLHVYFKEHSLVQYSQDVIYTIEDLIAAFGGLVGLCTGLSLLSIVEFVYFFTLRWGLQLCREKKEFRLKNINTESVPSDIQVIQ